MSSLGTLPPWRAPLWRYLCLAALLASPLPAFAELALTAAAITQYEYNSNVFDLPKPLPPGFALPVGTAASNYGDSFVAYGGKLDASYLWSQQQFFATIQGNDFHYDRFTGLDHSEYTLDGGWDWKVGRLWDGVLDVTRIRSMVSFLNLIGTSLVVQTEQRETGRASLQVTPDWRTEFTGMTRKVDQPQPDAPNLSLSESSGEALIKYVGTAGLTSGLMATYLKGAFSGIPSASASNVAAPAVVAPSYTQSSAGLTATDDVTGLSTFRGQIGYTRRSSDSGVNNVSALTGELDYKRTLTGKTSAALDLSRLVNVYLTNTATEIDNVAALTVDWQATYKIDVVLVYNFNYRELAGQGNVPLGSERVDRLNLIGLSATYEPVPWVILKPYVHYQEGASRNYIGPGGNFNSSVVGLQFTLQWQQGVIPPRTLLNY
jgi:hypothetical protein